VLPNKEQAFKVLPRRKAVDLLRRIFAKVPEKDFVAVRVEAERQVG
jgi:hypothetical protein